MSTGCMSVPARLGRPYGADGNTKGHESRSTKGHQDGGRDGPRGARLTTSSPAQGRAARPGPPSWVFVLIASWPFVFPSCSDCQVGCDAACRYGHAPRPEASIDRTRGPML